VINKSESQTAEVQGCTNRRVGVNERVAAQVPNSQAHGWTSHCSGVKYAQG